LSLQALAQDDWAAQLAIALGPLLVVGNAVLL
jgi:hypothetical protein